MAWHRPGLAHACPPRATLATTASARTQKNIKKPRNITFLTMKQPHHTRNRLLVLLVVDEVALRLRLPAEQALCGMVSPGARACLPTSRNPCDHSQCPNPKNIKNPRNITFLTMKQPHHTRNQLWWWTKSRCDSVCLRSRHFVAWHRPGLAPACPPRATLATTASARTQKTSKTPGISLFTL